MAGWVTINSQGLLSGTPTDVEIDTLLIQVQDSKGAVVQGYFGVTTTTGSVFSIITASPLPGAQVGVAYNENLQAQGGTAPYSWTMLSASPNSGLWLNLSPSGVLSGIPQVAVEQETIIIEAIDALGTLTQATFLLQVDNS